MRCFALASVLGLLLVSCDEERATVDPDIRADEWSTFARDLERSGYNDEPSALTEDTARGLAVKWKFVTDGPVAASPAVATVELPGEGPARLVVVGSYDGNVYALRASDGSEVWRYGVKPHPGVSYGLIASSATVATVGGEQRVFLGGGETMYALDAGTGDRAWEFDAGTGCTTCDPKSERNEVLSSPAVLPEQDLVLFGMDVNENTPGKGGFYAVSAQDGRLRWYFDVDTGAVCRPEKDDEVHRFDGFHDAADLGLPDDFFSTRDGCDFDRTETACGNVWSPVSVDLERELIYFSTSNCDTDDDPASAAPLPPMPRYNEALVALHFDGTPAWSWRPRGVDNDDLAFGAAPNLFSAEIDGRQRDVAGLGGKDGTYYLLDRDGENELTGNVEPYWQRQVVQGGSIGGITGTPAVANGTVFFGTGIGRNGEEFQRPAAWALSALDGSVLWSLPDAPPYYGGTSAVPGLVFMGGIDGALHVYDAATGEQLVALAVEGLAFSQPAIVDGEVFVGSGFGAAAATDSEEAARRATVKAAIWAFCVRGTDGCEDATPLP
jgi:polyvinyl alcohol dehydrogenase (cytochrome)